MSVDNSLLLEHLKALRADNLHFRGEFKEVKSRLSTLEIGVAGIRADLAHVSGDYARQQLALDTLGDRVERIERRLTLIDQPVEPL